MSTQAMEIPTTETADIAPITESDLIWWVDKISTLDWVFAVTYADGAPHEYICDRTDGMSTDDLERASRVIHTFGAPQKLYKRTRVYFMHNGWKYWTMDDDHREVTLINRGRSSHIYGVQNAPETVSVFATAYDPIATHWDTSFGLSSEEREEFKALVDEVTDGYRKCRTLDLGAGTGAALDLEITDAFRLTAVDPSGPMLNMLVRKHPLVARVEPMPFQVARNRRVFAGMSFDLVLALGGSGSYLTDEDWIALPDHAKGRYVISVFAEGEGPVAGDLSTDEVSRARENAATFASTHGGHIEWVGRFDVAVAHA